MIIRASLSIALTVVFSCRLIGADDVAWKPETEETALQILAKARESAGELHRFDIEYLQSWVQPAFNTETRSRVRVYCEDSVSLLIQCRAIDDALMQTSRRSASGECFKVTKGRPETWLLRDGSLTVVEEEHRTYDIVSVPPNESWLTELAHQAIPLWLEPRFDWKDFKSRFRIERAASTSTLFFIEYAPIQKAKERPKGFGFSFWLEDERLKGNHALYIDRKTLHPTKWWTKNETGGERTLIYTRFDVNPPKRELNISLDGYKDVRNKLERKPSQETKAAINTESLLLGARILFWLLF